MAMGIVEDKVSREQADRFKTAKGDPQGHKPAMVARATGIRLVMAGQGMEVEVMVAMASRADSARAGQHGRVAETQEAETVAEYHRHAICHCQPHLSSRKLTQKPYRIKYARHRPSCRAQPEART
jgi:hypothetical protein